MTDLNDRQSPVFLEKVGPIGRLVLNRPEKRNAMSEAMWASIPGAVARLDADPDVRVIIVCSSTEKAFSAGADIAELEQIATSPDRQESNRLAIREAQRTLARAKKPTIAQVAGACMGGGCGLAIHCDMRFAANTARFAITPAKLGLIYPLNDTKQLMDLVGPAKAKSMLFTGRVVDADEALRIGLVDELFSLGELAERTQAFAQQIAQVSQYSVRGIKQTIRLILDGQHDDDDQTAQMFKDAHTAEDATEGVRAFLEKRSPAFRWNGGSEA
ncbi:enoyl-CoA hydratase/isomerase family protein [Kordiimonas lacus]|uniref:Enoyl-CoA hydratase/carnithine racemase n=1 Tax=Kordiimonas lacus TaxID=637679 RepID=A0A1G7DFZ1_9PROT|nr:enoyl-CoA hydratase-related protein [Kordiimonas lacus]SDE49916.1 Enoyl-CoA hydratase/carnithine racemase [Kordiimonas lacus]